MELLSGWKLRKLGWELEKLDLGCCIRNYDGGKCEELWSLEGYKFGSLGNGPCDDVS